MTIYEKVTDLREKLGLSQSELERKADLSKGTITNWKNRKPNMTSLEKVAKALGCDVTYFMTDNEAPTYYLNEETKEIAHEIFLNKELKMLFDVTRNSTPQRLMAYYNMIRELEQQEHREE